MSWVWSSSQSHDEWFLATAVGRFSWAPPPSLCSWAAAKRFDLASTRRRVCETLRLRELGCRCKTRASANSKDRVPAGSNATSTRTELATMGAGGIIVVTPCRWLPPFHRAGERAAPTIRRSANRVSFAPRSSSSPSASKPACHGLHPGVIASVAASSSRARIGSFGWDQLL